MTLAGAPSRIGGRLEEEGVGVAGFETVYREYVEQIYRFCLTQLREPMLAEDATADVFTAALRVWPRLGRGVNSGIGCFESRVTSSPITTELLADANAKVSCSPACVDLGRHKIQKLWLLSATTCAALGRLSPV